MTNERTVTIAFDLTWDAQKGWWCREMRTENSGFLFDTVAERDDLIAVAELAVRHLCRTVFTRAESEEIRDSVVEHITVLRDPERSQRAVKLLLAAERADRDDETQPI